MLSIIVPVLNEALQVRPFLRHLRAHAPGAEIVVVDGGSVDATAALAAGGCDVLLSAPRGRSNQLNAGAATASGDVLWFVHVDCEIPPSAVGDISKALGEAGCVGGCFRVRIPDQRFIFRVHDDWGHWLGRLLRVRCGDHGIFCRRAEFARIGGFRDVPLMEDVILVRALHTCGAFAWVSSRLLLSARRHRQVGIYWYTFVCCAIVALFCLRVPCGVLAWAYGRLVGVRGDVAAQCLAVEQAMFSGFWEEAEESRLAADRSRVGRRDFSGGQ